MKIVLEHKDKKSVEEYPKLAKLLSNGTIVLFNSEHSGMVLKSNGFKIGHYGKDWVSINNEDVWEALPSDCVIKLSND